MKCPKCISPMVKVTFQSIEVDRCTDCQGIFVGDFEKEQLQQLEGADAIDSGDAEVGREFDRVNCIQCPGCGARMMRMVEPDHPHIRFEHCAICGGSFFDAGEFRDLTHYPLTDGTKRDLDVHPA